MSVTSLSPMNRGVKPMAREVSKAMGMKKEKTGGGGLFEQNKGSSDLNKAEEPKKFTNVFA